MANLLRNRRVLVVEDEFILADDLTHELEAAGAQVLGPVASVSDAMTLLAESDDVDAAALDVNLGGAFAYGVADVLARRGVPFLFTTGYDREVLPERYTGAPWAEKPLGTGEVVRRLGELVEGDARTAA